MTDWLVIILMTIVIALMHPLEVLSNDGGSLKAGLIYTLISVTVLFSSAKVYSVFLFKAAKKGNPKSQYYLGRWYYSFSRRHIGYSNMFYGNILKAIEWLEKSAEQGNADAQYMLGEIYYYGTVEIDQDIDRAKKWFKQAMRRFSTCKGRTKAEKMLELISKDQIIAEINKHNNLKLTSDQKKIAELFSLAEKGDSYSQFMIGQYYYYAVYTLPYDLDKAIEWLEKSAEQGQIDAQYMLGGIYHDRNSDKAYFNKAFEWFLKAAEQGHPLAQYELAYIYFFSLGVPKDLYKAKEWATKADANGSIIAKDLLKHIELQSNN